MVVKVIEFREKGVYISEKRDEEKKFYPKQLKLRIKLL